MNRVKEIEASIEKLNVVILDIEKFYGNGGEASEDLVYDAVCFLAAARSRLFKLKTLMIEDDLDG